jgi:hypothetical protein
MIYTVDVYAPTYHEDDLGIEAANEKAAIHNSFCVSPDDLYECNAVDRSVTTYVVTGENGKTKLYKRNH